MSLYDRRATNTGTAIQDLYTDARETYEDTVEAAKYAYKQAILGAQKVHEEERKRIQHEFLKDVKTLFEARYHYGEIELVMEGDMSVGIVSLNGKRLNQTTFATTPALTAQAIADLQKKRRTPRKF